MATSDLTSCVVAASDLTSCVVAASDLTSPLVARRTHQFFLHEGRLEEERVEGVLCASHLS